MQPTSGMTRKQWCGRIALQPTYVLTEVCTNSNRTCSPLFNGHGCICVVLSRRQCSTTQPADSPAMESKWITLGLLSFPFITLPG